MNNKSKHFIIAQSTFPVSMASDPHNALDIIVQSTSLVPVVRAVTIDTKEANNTGTREADTTGIGCGFTYVESKAKGLQTYAESTVKLVLLEEIEMSSAPRWQVAAALDSVDVRFEYIIKVVLSEAWIVGHSII
ncbi:hypothetical protein WN944_008269 [Citrus x changshan-huyou]|uniref:Uncharacterized protein n=1 Tax=Citrus x changshan-huyou TaxID=2935761 RepID=A0AAP0MQ89_9ROSI